ncbi:MAG TPA: HAD family hydrolase [Aquihabitans sp.]|jgi:putative hydrolase of the HAD superfamily|nr:HAD family hydrolase [Aquihabitans sp.]
MDDRRFDVVFLDAGGVLVQPDPAKISARFAGAGVEVDPSLLFEAHYRGVQAIDRAQAEPEVFVDYHLAYAAHLGLEPGSPDADAVVAALTDLWAASGLWTEPLPWAADGLRALAATGATLAVVSNADGTVADLLAGAGLLQVGPGPGVEVAAVIDSGAVGVAKPDPAIFALALDAVGVDATRAIHVGDAYQYDVRGARAAGVHPVLVDPLGIRDDVDCERVRDLAEVVALL